MAAYVYAALSMAAVSLLVVGANGGALGYAILLALVVAEIVNYGSRVVIRRWRFEHDQMTQQALAERVGLTRQTINAIELGKYSPSLEAAFRIAEVFGVPLTEVFAYDEEPS